MNTLDPLGVPADADSPPQPPLPARPPPPLAALRVLLFDIDGTLIKTGKGVRRAFKSALLETFHDVGRLDSYSFAGKTDPQIVDAVLEGSSVPPAVVAARRQECLDRYLANLEAEARGGAPPGAVLPGVRELLDLAASERRCALGLLTGNVAAGARLKLGALGLVDYFRFGAFSSDRPARDELPIVALSRARALFGDDLHPRQCWVIGDTEFDVRCARAGGMRAAAVATGSYSREALAAHAPDVLFDDFSCPAEVLARLLEDGPPGSTAPRP
ncbi:MAG: HAD hydrolase-like protein [Planctomycetes bacterium]|nr:HAD hydrolase-like protein [Planctomycetota bacterium]